MSGATNFSFTAYDPNDPTNVKTLTTKGGSIRDIPKGWMLKGEIEMQRNKYLDNTGSNEIKDTDLKMEIIDEGINNSYVKYSFDGYEVTSNLYLATSHVTAFNHVTYNLNGGTWTDTTLEAHPQLRWAENNGQLYQTFITPNQSVYKPTDPIRKGYKFIGWKSSSDIGKPNGSQSVHMDNYDFAEIDINTNADYVQGGIVSLVAQWEAQAPEFETETIEIVEGEKFNKSDLIKGEINYNDDDVNKEKRSVEYSYPEDFDPKTPGEYKVLVTVKNGVGETTEKEAKVIVKRKWTPIEPTPILAVQDKTIKVGDDFRLTDLITDGGVDNVEITPPEGFDKNKPGVYDITFTKTAENGSKIIKTAKLTILPKDEEEPFVYEEKYRTEEAFEIEVEFDEKLKAGQMVVDQEGQVGIKEITKKVTFRDGKVESVTTDETVIQVKQNKKIRVGNGFKELEGLKEYGVVIVNYVDEQGLTIKSSVVNSVKKLNSKYDTSENKVEIIEYNGKTYEFVKVKDNDAETGTITDPLTQVTYIYKLKDESTPEETGPTPEPPIDPKPDPEDPKPNPENPETPGGEEPKDPETPGEEDPEEPGKPGEEDPKDPSKPGEEDPKDPETPGGGDPKEPGTPQEPGKPEQPNVPAQPNNPEQGNKVTSSKDKEDDKILPNTGEAERDLTLFATALAALGGVFAFGRRRNRKED